MRNLPAAPRFIRLYRKSTGRTALVSTDQIVLLEQILSNASVNVVLVTGLVATFEHVSYHAIAEQLESDPSFIEVVSTRTGGCFLLNLQHALIIEKTADLEKGTSVLLANGAQMMLPLLHDDVMAKITALNPAASPDANGVAPDTRGLVNESNIILPDATKPPHGRRF